MLLTTTANTGLTGSFGGGGHDKVCDLVRVRNHGDMTGFDFNGGRAHTCGEKALRIRRDDLIIGSDQKPRGQRLPCWNAHNIREESDRRRLLYCIHDVRLNRIDILREKIDKILMTEPRIAQFVDDQMLN